MSDYFPVHALLLEHTQIDRERRLPPNVYGTVEVNAGDEVVFNDVVLRGRRTSDYVIVDVANALGLNPEADAERLAAAIPFKPNDIIEPGTLLATPGRGIRKRAIPRAPVYGRVSLVEHGRVILQQEPEVVQVFARLPGTVADVAQDNSVIIRNRGALLQCAWGNGQFNMTFFSFEPGFEAGEGASELSGLADILNLDVSLSPYRGRTIILMRPVTEEDLMIIQMRELGGIVAPCAAPDLREAALRLNVPVILTEGFGDLQPTSRLYDILYDRRTQSAVFDATPLNFREGTRPEIIIPGGKRDAPAPDLDQALRVGEAVRIRRAPHAGRIGEVMALPAASVRLENGLRVPAVEVKLRNGERVIVPRANIESLGR
ncbi:MAG: hypothetical protein ACLFTK_15300 [Anaerolineales bacterium]